MKMAGRVGTTLALQREPPGTAEAGTCLLNLQKVC